MDEPIIKVPKRFLNQAKNLAWFLKTAICSEKQRRLLNERLIEMQEAPYEI